jgi:hypothetical protein
MRFFPLICSTKVAFLELWKTVFFYHKFVEKKIGCKISYFHSKPTLNFQILCVKNFTWFFFDIIFWLTLRIWCFFFELLQETELFYQTEKQYLFKFARSGKWSFSLCSVYIEYFDLFSSLFSSQRSWWVFLSPKITASSTCFFFNKQRVLVSVFTFLRSLLESEILLLWMRISLFMVRKKNTKNY